MKYFVYFIIAVVAAAIVGGFFVVGSPNEARLRAFDERRIQDLQSIQGQIVYFYQSKSRLPNTLAELRDDISGFIPPQDPQTSVEYTYTTQGSLTFSLCATFNLPSNAKMNTNVARPMAYPAGEISQSWDHATGNVCFERTIDPDLYPPIPKTKQ